MICDNACHLVSNIIPCSCLQWNKKTAWHTTAVFFHTSFITLLPIVQGSNAELRLICSCFSHKVIIFRLLYSLLSVKETPINISTYKKCLKWMEKNSLYLNFSTQLPSTFLYFRGLKKPILSIGGTQDTKAAFAILLPLSQENEESCWSMPEPELNKTYILHV